MTTQTLPASRRWFSKSWLLEQKSLIALLVPVGASAQWILMQREQ